MTFNQTGYNAGELFYNNAVVDIDLTTLGLPVFEDVKFMGSFKFKTLSNKENQVLSFSYSFDDGEVHTFKIEVDHFPTKNPKFLEVNVDGVDYNPSLWNQ